ncbi:hypothetical protein NUW58_g961 [Xylaria curta]|uniref:Uncharacterized protein n=2 Tax=Xylaria curta TaxID=42375 RepID=A0ACC1PQL5_9PEZI|nr:hypothetical protein NUW58_g3842 [Xylaria curta]KAJ2996491.1 hypothetical protein NUW58_g961 [Xylaria curta]
MVNRNIGLAKDLTLSLMSDEVLYSKASSQLARFKLWAGSLGAHYKSGRRSLEYRLRDASPIRQHVIKLLEQLSKATEDASSTSTSCVSAAPETRDSLDPELVEYLVENDESTQSSIDLALSEINHIIDCLFHLSMAMRNPAPHDLYMSRAAGETMAYYEQFDVKHVQEKFPQADIKSAERLGAAITIRRYFLKYRQDHYGRLASGIDYDGLEPEGDQSTVAYSVPESLKNTRGSSSIDTEVRSVVSMTTYSPPLNNSEQIRVPPIPEGYLNGPILCPFCCQMVEIDSGNWKRHVFRDLEPYVCLAPSCLTPGHNFSRRTDWSSHMEQMHWRIWRCSCGCPQVFDTSDEFQDHLRKLHLGDLAIQQHKTAEQMCSQPDLSKSIGPCPLCGDHISSATQYHTHVGYHLEQLALFALPRTTNDIGETGSQRNAAEEKDFDQESQDYNSSIAASVSGGQSQTSEVLENNGSQRDAGEDKDFIQESQDHNSSIPTSVSGGQRSQGFNPLRNTRGPGTDEMSLQIDPSKWRWACVSPPARITPQLCDRVPVAVIVVTAAAKSGQRDRDLEAYLLEANAFLRGC